MKNLDIRQEAQAAKIRQWEIADALGMNDANFSKKLRYELSDSEKSHIRKIIAEIAKEREASA